MRFLFLFSTSMIALVLASCTNGNPSLSMLSSINGITFSSEKKSTESYTISTAPTCQSDLLVTGQCDQRFEQLQFSIDGESSWTRMTGYNANSDGDCSDGEFKLYFPNVCSSFNVTNNGNEIKKILIRAEKNLAQNTTREATIKFSSEVSSAARISIADAGAVAEGSAATFTVSLNSAKTVPVTVNYSVVLGTATAGDFSSLTSGTVTFAAGETVKTISIATSDNALVCEATKTFSVNLSNPSANATIATSLGLAQIVDPDRPVLNFIDSNGASPGIVDVAEGGSTLVSVGISAVCPTHDVKFDWSRLDETALAPADYVSMFGSTMIAKGQTSVNIPAAANQDSLVEGNEYYSIKLSNPIEASIGDAEGAVYIIDDDLPVASISTASGFESSSISFVITLSSASTNTVTMNYTFSHVTTKDADFLVIPISGTITITPGNTTQVLNFQLNDDNIDEPDQTFTVKLETAGAVGATISSTNAIGTGTIQDNDVEPTLNISTNIATISEGDGTATFLVTPSVPSEKTITVSFSTSDSTAVAGEDYNAVSNTTVTIMPNATAGMQSINIIDDTIDEPRQSYIGTISSPTNATLGSTKAAQQFLTDNDPEPSVSIANGSGTEGGTVLLKATLSAGSQQTFSVDYATTLVSASAGDFTGVYTSGTITFPINTLSQDITFTTVDDALVEGSETFTVGLATPQNTFLPADASGNITIFNATATGTILDNEAFGPPVLTLLTPSQTPAISSKPTIQVSGIAAADEVSIYSDATCDTLLASDISSGTTLNITLPGLAAGSHTFYTNRKKGTVYSLCSTTGLAYTYVIPVVTPVYPINGANWNDYISFSDTSSNIYKQTDTACSGSETGPTNQLNGCIHGAEKLKVVATGFSTCTNLSINENLANFEWECVSTSGTVTFYSKGLKSGRGLRDLIDFATATWKQNSVTISYSSLDISASNSTEWWTNVISDLSGPLNNSTSTSVNSLNQVGRVYILRNNQDTFGYSISADKISLVTASSAGLNKYEPSDTYNCNSTTGEWSNSASDNIDTVICTGNTKFLWIEANLSGFSGTYQPNYALYSTGMKRSQIRNSIAKGFSHASVLSAVKLYNSHYNLIQGLVIHDTGSGLLLHSSSHNTIIGLGISNTYGPSSTSPTAVEINGATAEFNTLHMVRVSNHGKDSTDTAAIELKASRNIISRAIITNTLGSSYTCGIRFWGSSANENILSQIIISGSSRFGISFDGGSERNILSNLTIANVRYGLHFFGGSPTQNVFTSLAINNTKVGVFAESSVPVGPHNNILEDMFVSTSVDYAFDFQNYYFAIPRGFILYDPLSDCGSGAQVDFCSTSAVTATSALSTSDILGPIYVNDSANPDDSNGEGLYSTLSLDGALKFDHWYRGWSKDGNLNFSSSMGSSTAALRIWDFGAVAGGKLANHSGVGVSTNSTLSLDGLDCSSNTVTNSKINTTNGITYYKNAIEIFGDGIGNDNELCEYGESCFYAPNIGGAQPSGSLSVNFCTVDYITKIYVRAP